MTHRTPHRPLAIFRSPSRVVAAALVTCGLVACGQRSTVGADPDPNPTAVTGASGARAVMSPAAVLVDDLNDPRQVGRRDPARVTAARVDGDTLRLTVETGGGCRQHLFRLAVLRAFRESHPVQVGAALGHDANGDQCRALIRADLAVSLTPLAAAYRAAYRTQSGTVVVHLDGWSGGLRYTF